MDHRHKGTVKEKGERKVNCPMLKNLRSGSCESFHISNYNFTAIYAYIIVDMMDAN